MNVLKTLWLNPFEEISLSECKMTKRFCKDGSRFIQYFAATISLTNMLISGMHDGWSSPTLPILQSNHSTTPIDDSQGSWITVMPLLGAPVGCLLVGSTIDYFGRKTFLLMAFVPYFFAWIMVAFAQNFAVLCLARFLAGISDGWTFTSTPIYICEICDAKIRGLFGASIIVSWNIGVLLINIMGSYMNIRDTALVSSVIPIIGFLAFVTLPESPYFYLLKNDSDKAKNSLQRLKGTDDVNDELDRLTSAVKEQTDNSRKYLDLFKVKENRKAVYIMVMFKTIQQAGGINVVIFYTQPIFQEISGNISIQTAAIILFTLQLVLSCISAAIVDKTGRRILIVSTSFISSIFIFLAGAYFYFKSKSSLDMSNWALIPVITLMGYIVAVSLGIQPVPMFVIAELFPISVKGVAVCLADIYYCILCTVCTKFFQITKDAYGVQVPFFTFGVVLFLGGFYVWAYVPETKGKTLEEIQDNITGKDKKITLFHLCNAENNSGTLFRQRKKLSIERKMKNIELVNSVNFNCITE